MALGDGTTPSECGRLLARVDGRNCSVFFTIRRVIYGSAESWVGCAVPPLSGTLNESNPRGAERHSIFGPGSSGAVFAARRGPAFACAGEVLAGAAGGIP